MTEGERASPYGVLAVVAVGTFMSALGGSLVNITIPTIRTELHADMGLASWVLAAYSLAVSALLLPAGRVGDLFGKRRVYVVGFIVFGASSALAANAPTLASLIASRALQGAGAAMLMATGPALTTAAFPPAQRGRALGMQATATYLGLSFGPSIGGFLTSAYGFRSVFWINVPIAFAGAVFARLRLSAPPLAPASAFPWRSAVLLGPALTAILVPLTRGASWGWGNPLVVGLAALGVALFAGYVAAERRADAPLVSGALLFEPIMLGGVTAAFLQYAANYALLFLMPFYLQGPLRMTTKEAGVLLTVQPAVMALTTASSGWLSDRIGTRLPSALGMLLVAGGIASVAALGADPSLPRVALALVLVGLGAGLFTSPNNSSIMGAAPRERQGTAAGLLAEARNTGMLAGVSLAGVLFAGFSGVGLSEGARGMPASQFVRAFGATLMVPVALALLGAAIAALRPRNQA